MFADLPTLLADPGASFEERDNPPSLGGPVIVVVEVAFLLWSAYVWVFAVRRARSVTTGQATVVVAVPISAALILVGFPGATPGLDV